MSKLLLTVGLFFIFYSLHAQTFNGTGGTIPDGGAQTCFNIPVTGVGVINAVYGLASVCINITHTWDGDLRLFLKAPNNQVLNLVNARGGSADNIGN